MDNSESDCHTHTVSIRNVYRINSTWNEAEVRRRVGIHVIITRPVVSETATGTFSSRVYKCVVRSCPKLIVLLHSIHGYEFNAWGFQLKWHSRSSWISESSERCYLRQMFLQHDLSVVLNNFPPGTCQMYYQHNRATSSLQPDHHGMSELAAQWRASRGEAENWPGRSPVLNPSDYRTIN